MRNYRRLYSTEVTHRLDTTILNTEIKSRRLSSRALIT